MALNYVSTSCSNVKLSFIIKSMGKGWPWNYNDSIGKGQIINKKHLPKQPVFLVWTRPIYLRHDSFTYSIHFDS